MVRLELLNLRDLCPDQIRNPNPQLETRNSKPATHIIHFKWLIFCADLNPGV